MPSIGENRRPSIPNNHPWSKELARIIGRCWQLQPSSRPEFSNVVTSLEVIGRKYSVSLQHTSPDLERTPRIPPKMSPDMRPVISLPIIPPCKCGVGFPCAADSNTTPVDEGSQERSGTDPPHNAAHDGLSKWRNRPSVGSGYDPDPESPSVGTGTNSSILDSGLDGEEYTHIGMDSPPPLGETLADIKDERQYRMLLQHEFHPSRTFLLVPM